MSENLPLPAPRETSQALVRASLESLEAAIGGRAALQATLEQAPPNKDLTYVINAIADPTNDARDLAKICAECGISVGELLQAYKMGAMAQAQTLAVARIAGHTPAVAEDVMRRAAPYEETCHVCRGVKATTADPTPAEPNPSPVPCETCQATGVLLYQPEFARQKLALELAGLLGGKSGLNINITQANSQVNAAVSGDPGALARLQAATDQVLYSEPLRPDELGPVDGEVADAGDR